MLPLLTGGYYSLRALPFNISIFSQVINKHRYMLAGNIICMFSEALKELFDVFSINILAR